jgi:DNA polymerase-3 subunit chi
MPRILFYLSSGTDERSRFRIACRLTEQAYLSGQRVFVRLQDASQLKSFDDLLWTFADRSFVPHETFKEEAQWQQTPVLIGYEAQPQLSFDMLLNLADDVPSCVALASQVAEIIDGDEEHKRAGRIRFRHYRDNGMTPETHNIASATSEGSQPDGKSLLPR